MDFTSSSRTIIEAHRRRALTISLTTALQPDRLETERKKTNKRNNNNKHKNDDGWGEGEGGSSLFWIKPSFKWNSRHPRCYPAPLGSTKYTIIPNARANSSSEVDVAPHSFLLVEHPPPPSLPPLLGTSVKQSNTQQQPTTTKKSVIQRNSPSSPSSAALSKRSRKEWNKELPRTSMNIQNYSTI